MGKMIFVALVVGFLGVALGVIQSSAEIAWWRKRVRELNQMLKDGTGSKGKMGTMDKILVLEAVILVVYTTAALVVFWHTGSEPATLTACVFSLCGIENGVMGWIKTNKDKQAAKAEPKFENLSKHNAWPDKPGTDGSDDGAG